MVSTLPHIMDAHRNSTNDTVSVPQLQTIGADQPFAIHLSKPVTGNAPGAPTVVNLPPSLFGGSDTPDALNVIWVYPSQNGQPPTIVHVPASAASVSQAHGSVAGSERSDAPSSTTVRQDDVLSEGDVSIIDFIKSPPALPQPVIMQRPSRSSSWATSRSRSRSQSPRRSRSPHRAPSPVYVHTEPRARSRSPSPGFGYLPTPVMVPQPPPPKVLRRPLQPIIVQTPIMHARNRGPTMIPRQVKGPVSRHQAPIVIDAPRGRSRSRSRSPRIQSPHSVDRSITPSTRPYSPVKVPPVYSRCSHYSSTQLSYGDASAPVPDIPYTAKQNAKNTGRTLADSFESMNIDDVNGGKPKGRARRRPDVNDAEFKPPGLVDHKYKGTRRCPPAPFTSGPNGLNGGPRPFRPVESVASPFKPMQTRASTPLSQLNHPTGFANPPGLPVYDPAQWGPYSPVLPGAMPVWNSHPPLPPPPPLPFACPPPPPAPFGGNEIFPYYASTNTGLRGSQQGRHPVYNFSDASLALLVEGTEYRVHRHFFERYSSSFKNALLPYTPVMNMIPTISLLSTTKKEIEVLLGIFYLEMDEASSRVADPEREFEDAQAVFRLTHRWGFDSVCKWYMARYEAVGSAIDRVLLAKENLLKSNNPIGNTAQAYNSWGSPIMPFHPPYPTNFGAQDQKPSAKPDWKAYLMNAYKELCLVGTALSIPDAQKLGLETAMKIWQIQDHLKTDYPQVIPMRGRHPHPAFGRVTAKDLSYIDSRTMAIIEGVIKQKFGLEE